MKLFLTILCIIIAFVMVSANIIDGKIEQRSNKNETSKSYIQNNLLHERGYRQLLLRGSRNLAEFAALDDTLAALKASDATAGNNVETYHPVFDMDTDSCLPAAAVSRTGQQNPGLGTVGRLTSGCRASNFMQLSNTYHRWDREIVNGVTYEVHMFELYFEKDVVFNFFGGGHRHDMETVFMIFVDDSPQWVGVSAHGNYDGDRTRQWSSVPKEGSHPKVVYHKDGLTTHSLRFAKSNEPLAENPTGQWVLPPLASWVHMIGDGQSNEQMRFYFNIFDYGSASFKIKDASCQSESNKFRGEIKEQGTYIPFFDFDLNTNIEVYTDYFSEESVNYRYCPQLASQSVLAGLFCSGRYCDNLKLHCSYKDDVQVDTDTAIWTGSFSEEQGLGSCPTNSVITGIKCTGRYCDNLSLYCQRFTNNTLNYGLCFETSWVSEEQGYVSIPSGGYPVGIRCSGRYCDNKKLRYCYP